MPACRVETAGIPSAPASISAVGVPSALSGGEGPLGKGLAEATGRNFFDWADFLASNVMLPAGGLLMAVFVGFALDRTLRHAEFLRGTSWGKLYAGWLGLLRYLVPLAVGLVFLHSVGLLG